MSHAKHHSWSVGGVDENISYWIYPARANNSNVYDNIHNCIQTSEQIDTDNQTSESLRR